MKIGIKVGDIMTRNFVAVEPETSIVECARLMTKHKIGSLVVKKGQELKGILTDSDLIEAIAKGIDVKKTKAEKLMTRKVITITPSKDISDAFQLMSRKKVRRLPVVIDNKVIGLLTEKDILKIQPDLFEIGMQKIKIAEEEEKLKRARAVDEYRWVREGPCQECGCYDLLYKVGNRFLCANCRKSAEGLWEE